MTDWQEVMRRAAISGSSASLASTALLLGMGQRDCSSVSAPVNAISHWLWGDRAIPQQNASLRYTVPGFVIHHSASVFWAVFQERYLITQTEPPSISTTIRTGIVVAALACFVDLCLTPRRFTPGFERRLKPDALALVYGAFGVGLALPALVRALARARRPRQ